MRLSRVLFLAWMIGAMVCATALGQAAQGQAAAGAGGYAATDAAPAAGAGGNAAMDAAPAAGAGGNAAMDAAPTAGAPAVGAGREWVPEGVEALGQRASSRTEFTLDHSILVLVSKLEKDNPELRRVIAGVNGVSVHSFHFAGRVAPDAAAMASIGQQYEEAGWLHAVSKHRNDSGETTDVWIHLDQAAIRDVAVLMVKAREVDFVSASGSVSPLDLLHLSGHFGIPQMDGGEAVPVPERQGR